MPCRQESGATLPAHHHAACAGHLWNYLSFAGFLTAKAGYLPAGYVEVNFCRRPGRYHVEGPVPASAAASAEQWAPDCTLLIPGNNRFSGEHRGREPQQLFADGRGHVVGVLRWTADRDGRHLDSLGASVYAIVGGRLASLEQCEEDVGRVDVFWGGNAGAGAGLATDWRADIDTLLRSYQANEETPDSAHREACTADVRHHVPVRAPPVVW
jgi:hypothetical protein